MNQNKKVHIIPVLQAILAALLFGASAPFAKILLGEVEPVTLAGLLYLGSGIALALIKLGQKLFRSSNSTAIEAKLEKNDTKWLIGAVIAGGVAAPIVQLFGLRSTPGSTASLLLNFESVATTLIAALIFKEHVSKRALWAIIFVTLASVFLTVDLTSGWGLSMGALGVIGACVLWGFDNNFTRNISAKNPQTIVMVKGLAAGSFSLILALLLGNNLPQPTVVLKALLLGSLSYGLSITFFIRAMRGLGAARTSALFATSPLAGMGFSFLLLHETPGVAIFIAFPLMVIGTLFLLNEEHHHVHVHSAIIHTHAHRHDDEHHDHFHNIPITKTKWHSHSHEHNELKHDHEHLPDVDHRHSHNSN